MEVEVTASEEILNNPPEQPEREPYKNFGQVKVWLADQTWPTPGGRPEYVPHQEISTGTLYIVFESDLSELNPNSLYPEFQREVPVIKNEDWEQIVRPSLLKMFGNDYVTKMMIPFYAQWQMVPRVDGKTSSSGNPLTVPLFLQLYSGKAECIAALDALKASNGSAPTVTDDTRIAELIEQAKQFKNAVGADKTLSTMNQLKLLENVTAEQVDEIMTAAGVSAE